MNPLQLDMFQNTNAAVHKNAVLCLNDSRNKYGTFKDSLKAPIHRWFTYPAGYSCKLVEEKIRENSLKKGSWIFDPFVGTGTTSIAAREMGMNSVGIEAHPFVFWIAQTKLCVAYDLKKIEAKVANFISKVIASSFTDYKKVSLSDVPELVLKCYSQDNLKKLYFLLGLIEQEKLTETEKSFFKVALVGTLRLSSSAGTGWPYIAPSKYQGKKIEKEAFATYCKQLQMMLNDIKITFKDVVNLRSVETKLIKGSSKDDHGLTANSMDMLVTSPPYLNNYDYADRTRLEMYFFGMAKSWGEITHKVRNKLMIAATTQVNGSNERAIKLNEDILRTDADVYQFLSDAINKLNNIKKTRKGKKNYDWMVTGYFNDLFCVLKRTTKVMKRRSKSYWVLGDSAPYGVYIPTEEIIGKLAVGLGSRKYEVEVIRKRGDKWAKNPQRHGVKLKESILMIYK